MDVKMHNHTLNESIMMCLEINYFTQNVAKL